MSLCSISLKRQFPPWSNKFVIQKFFEIDMANPYISQNNCHKQQDTAPSPLGEGWGVASD